VASSGVLCDKRIPLKLKGRVYRMIVRPAFLYGVLAYQKVRHIEDEGCRNENDLLDMWSHET